MSYSTDEIAKGARTTLRGVRLWESAGLLGDVPRNENGHRVFSEDHMKRARIISAAQMAGMSLAELPGTTATNLWVKIGEGAMFMSQVMTENFSPDFDL